MARVKATTTDIYARLARGECANFRNNSCQGHIPCTVVNGEPCTYFTTYVQPLLTYPDFANKYGREAKITVALNPRAKVIRKPRQEPALAIETPAAVVPAKSPQRRPAKPASIPRTQQPSIAPKPEIIAPSHTPAAVQGTGKPHTKPATASAAKRAITPARPLAQEQPELLLELTPALPIKAKRR